MLIVKYYRNAAYFVESLDVKPEHVGLKSSDYSETYKVTLSEDAEALRTTHKRNKGYWRNPAKKLDGGGVQIYSPEIQKSGKFDPVKKG